MTFKTIIKAQIRGNLHTYKEYFLSTVFSVALIFMTLMIIYHPQMQLSSLSQNFVSAAKAVTFIIGIFLFIFIYYSQYTFIKHRSRDYAMFSILGMKRKQLILLNFCESGTVFLSALITGMLSAMLFAKLIFMGFAALLEIDQMPLYFPTSPIVVTAIIFSFVFIIIEALSIIILRRTRIKDFLQFGKTAQKQKKVNVPVAIIGVLLIAAGYYLAATVNDENILQRIIPVIVMVVAGMYCFYRELCPWILRCLSKNKSFYYRGVNMLWISDLKYRIKDFTAILFLITVTMSVGLTGFSAVFNVASAELELDSMKDSRYPIAVMHASLASGNFGSVAPSEENIAEAVRDEEATSSTVAGVEKMLDSLGVSYSEVKLKLYSSITNSRLLINRSDLHYFLGSEDLSKLDFAGEDTLLIGIRGRDLDVELPFRNVVGVADGKMDEHANGFEEMNMTLFSYKEKANVGKRLMQLSDKIYYSEDKTDRIYSSELFRYFYFIARRSYLLISFYFVIVFYICAGCMLYFKFFNNAVEDGEKYSNYSKVGLSEREIRCSSTIQMASLFFLPGILTVLNTAFAMKALIATNSPDTFISNTVIIILFTIAVQVIYFFIIRHRYLKKLTLS